MADDNTTPKWNTALTDGVTYSFITAETAEPVCAFTTESDCAYIITADVVAVTNDSYDEVNAYKFAAGFKNDGGTLTQIGSTASLLSVEGHAGWACTFAVSSPDVQVTFTTDDTSPVWVRTRLNILKLGRNCPHMYGDSANA